jgi:hypothetical protein
MRKVAFWTALVVVIVFAAGPAAGQASRSQVGVVAFNHAKHGKDCAACHHKDKAGAEQKCSKCHGDKTEGKKLSLKESFHAQCKDCHKKVKKGPVKCDECHPKK